MTRVLSFVFRIVFLSAAFSLVVGCGTDTTKGASNCPEGEIEAKIGQDAEAQCYPTCPCDAGFVCKQGKVCVIASGNNGGGNNGGTNNGGTNNGGMNNGGTNNGGTNNGGTNNGGINNGGTNNGTTCTIENQDMVCASGELCVQGTCETPDSTILNECEQFCDLIWGSCLDNNCTDLDQAVLDEIEQRCIYGGVTTGAEPQTIQGCIRDSQASNMSRTQTQEFVADETCDTLSWLRCGEFGLAEQCGCTSPTTGTACTQASDCNAGDLEASCIEETNDQGMDTGFTGGYCVADPCPVPDSLEVGDAYPSDSCGDDGACLIVQADAARCFDRCTQSSDCRSGYGCSVFSIITLTDQQTMEMTTEIVRLCFPECSSNQDCEMGQQCNADGECEFACGNADATTLCQDNGGTCVNDSMGNPYCSLP